MKLLPFDNKPSCRWSSTCPRARRWRTPTARSSGGPRGARGLPEVVSFETLRRHGGALQLQRARPPLLSALATRAGRRAGQPLARRASATGRATPSRSRSASGSPALDSRRAPRSRWWSRRPGRRCWRRCSPRSTARTRRRGAPWPRKVEEAFRSVPFVVDVDNSYGEPARRLRVGHLPGQPEFYRVSRSRRLRHDLAILGGRTTVGYSHRGGGRQPIPIRIERPARRQDPGRTVSYHAGPRQRAAGRPSRGRTRRCGPRDARSGPRSRSSGTTDARPRW